MTPADTPTTCPDCGGKLSRRRAEKGFTHCRACAKARNQRAWQDRADRLRFLRGPHSPLSPEAKRALPRR